MIQKLRFASPLNIFIASILIPQAFISSANQVEVVFTNIYTTNAWHSKETVSGPGSELSVTKNMRSELTKLIEQFQVTSIADAPCGDFNWMRLVCLGPCKYTGIDIVQAIIEQNTKLYENPSRTFKHLNLIQDTIDAVDLIICRDMLAHLSYAQIFEVIKNFKKSSSKYLLVTTNIRTEINQDISTGDWRLLNLEKAPFNFPQPLALIEEDVPFELERGKCLGLWLLEDINVN